MAKNTRESILAKVGTVPTGPKGCLLWTAGRDDEGYPLVKWEGKTHRALRLIWTFLKGEVPPGLQVLHHCDNPPCAKEDHLFLGTNAENMRDKKEKGRGAIGDKNGRRTHPENWPRGDQHWTHLHPELLTRGESSGAAKASDDEVVLMRLAVIEDPNVTVAEISRRFGLSYSQTLRIVRGESRISK